MAQLLVSLVAMSQPDSIPPINDNLLLPQVMRTVMSACPLPLQGLGVFLYSTLGCGCVRFPVQEAIDVSVTVSGLFSLVSRLGYYEACRPVGQPNTD